MTRNRWSVSIVTVPYVILTPLGVVGCASKGYVSQEVSREVATVHARVDDVEGQVEANQQRLDVQGERIEAVSGVAESASQTAREALDRAVNAGKLAEGKLLFETALTDDKVKFGFDEDTLSPEGKAALDEVAGQLVAANESVYVEIQGHTDATGTDDYNLELGFERAQAVLRYLNMRHGVPLHRMSAISYGESAPVADNSSRDGRVQNRRVVLVVLK
ncbi:MAG TPA: OmpA family protein [Thermoanaerobaculia bacterium]